MAKYTFIGDADGDGPDEINYFGFTFEKNGDAVEVTDEDVAAKLDFNNHFVEGKPKGRPRGVKSKPMEAGDPKEVA